MDVVRLQVVAPAVQAGKMNYLILVPTLRCNLACGYCQVSRAPENARGFDWSVETMEGLFIPWRTGGAGHQDRVPGRRAFAAGRPVGNGPRFLPGKVFPIPVRCLHEPAGTG